LDFCGKPPPPESTDLPLNELRAAAPVLKIRLEEIGTEADAKALESAFQTAK
jgi:hypothetical protein